MTYRGKRRSGPWYRDGRELSPFDWGVRSKVPSLKRFIDGKGLRYDLTVEVPYFEPRRVTILFRPDYPSPTVTVDGPTNSPHRFRGGALCMWYYMDDASSKWVRSDKLLALIGVIVRHLFKEAWWRETGKWLGPDVAHDQKTEEPKERGHE
jgi:hypothetical protein